MRIALLAIALLADSLSAQTVSIAALQPQAAEAGLVAGQVLVSRTGSTAQSLSVVLGRSGSASNGNDYEFLQASVQIPVNAASQLIEVRPFADNAVEGAESIVLEVMPSAAYSVGVANVATVNLSDDPPRLSVSAVDAAAAELGLDPAALIISRSGGNRASPLSVTLARSGSASNASDYQFIPAGTSIPAQTDSVSIALTPLADNVVEGTETVVLGVASSPGNYLIDGSATIDLTLADDPPRLTVTSADTQAAELGLNPAQVTITRSGGNRASPLSVSLARTGSASNSSDYQFLGASSTIGANADSVAITVAPLADNLVEGTETVVLGVASSPGNYLVDGNATIDVSLADDPPRLTVASNDTQAAELGLNPAHVTVTRTGGNRASALSISLLRAGTASNSADFQFLSASATIGADSDSVAVTVLPFADNLVEGTESVVLGVASSPGNYLVDGNATVDLALLDDPPVLSVSVSDGDASEAPGDTGSFLFTRTGGNIEASLPIVLSVGGTASNSVDYEFISTAASLPLNQSSSTLVLRPIFDLQIEGPETVRLSLGPSSSYLPGAPSSAEIVIRDFIDSVFNNGFE